MESFVEFFISQSWHMIYPPYSYISNLFIKSSICSIIRVICKLKSRKFVFKGDISSGSRVFIEEGSHGLEGDETNPNCLDKSLTLSLSCVNDVSFILSCVCITALVSHSPDEDFSDILSV